MVGFDVSQWLRSFCIKKKMDGEGLRERERERKRCMLLCDRERELGVTVSVIKEKKGKWCEQCVG